MKFYLQETCSATWVAGTAFLNELASSEETTSWYAGGADAAMLSYEKARLLRPRQRARQRAETEGNFPALRECGIVFITSRRNFSLASCLNDYLEQRNFASFSKDLSELS